MYDDELTDEEIFERLVRQDPYRQKFIDRGFLRHVDRKLNEEEMAASRGPRTKRNAREYAAVEQPAAIIDSVLAAEVNLLGGPTEAGKSLLARDWTLAVASGRAWRWYMVPEPRNCLYIASEGLNDYRERWENHLLFEAAADRIFILDEPVSLVSGDDVRWLLKEYDNECPGLVVFDLIYAMGLPDDNGTRDVAPLLANMKKISAAWGAATLGIGHPGHIGERRFRGWSGWRQQAATEHHMADGLYSCEKSKITDKVKLGASYAVEYPDLRWLDGSEELSREAGRRMLVEDDITRDPSLSDTARYRKLKDKLGLGDNRGRRLIKEIREEMGVKPPTGSK